MVRKSDLVLKQKLALLFIFITGCFWRFWNFENRWVLGAEQAKNILISKSDILNPYYFLLNLFSYIPKVDGPWLGFCAMSCGSILMAFWIGKIVLNRLFGLCLSLVVAWSGILIFQSGDIVNNFVVWPFCLFSFLCVAKLYKSRKTYWAFILGLSIGLACLVSWQSFGLLIMLTVASLFFSKKRLDKMLVFLIAMLGFSIALIPQLVMDSGQNFSWFKSVVAAQTEGLGRNSLWFWPKLWGEIVFARPETGYVLVFFGLVTIGLYWKKNLITKVPIVVTTYLLSLVLMVIFYGDRFESNMLVFTYPFFIFFTAWIFYTFYSLILNREFLLWICICLIGFWTFQNKDIVKIKSGNEKIFVSKNKIDKNISGKVKFYQIGNSENLTIPLMYLYNFENRLSEDGTGVVSLVDGDEYVVFPWSKEVVEAVRVDKILY